MVEEVCLIQISLILDAVNFDCDWSGSTEFDKDKSKFDRGKSDSAKFDRGKSGRGKLGRDQGDVIRVMKIDWME